MLNLTITADDCGLSRGIDQSVIDLHQSSMVSAASIMANFPQAQAAFEAYSACPTLELGAHLTLTDGKPLTRAAKRSGLVKHNGYFHDRFFLFSMSLFPSEKMLGIVREELSAQLDVFVEAGLRASHITTHHHFHTIPAMRKIVHELAKQYEVSWVRNSDFRLSLVPFNPIFSNKLVTVQQAPTTTDYLTPIKVWLDYSPQALLNAVLKLDGWLELIVHPCIFSDPSYPSDVIYSPAERYREAEYLRRFFDILQPHLGREVQLVEGQAQRKLERYA